MGDQHQEALRDKHTTRLEEAHDWEGIVPAGTMKPQGVWVRWQGTEINVLIPYIQILVMHKTQNV